MLELSMTSSGPHQEPAIFTKKFNDITDFHGPTLLSVSTPVKTEMGTILEAG